MHDECTMCAQYFETGRLKAFRKSCREDDETTLTRNTLSWTDVRNVVVLTRRREGGGGGGEGGEGGAGGVGLGGHRFSTQMFAHYSRTHAHLVIGRARFSEAARAGPQ